MSIFHDKVQCVHISYKILDKKSDIFLKDCYEKSLLDVGAFIRVMLILLLFEPI